MQSADVLVVGAGPYGLSAAAQLRGRGVRVAIVGKVMELWREHMPDGMLLRSQWWASNLSAPGGRHSLRAFLREIGQEPRYPLPRELFLAYTRWFQEREVPDVDETYVTRLDREGAGFRARLADGREQSARAVVLATGLLAHARRPDFAAGLPAGTVSHCSELTEPRRFAGRRVIVLGGGQSATEYAALLHEAGAEVDLIARRSIDWLGEDRSGRRTLLERLRAPGASIGPGWTNWALDHAPYLYQRLPRSRRDRALRNYCQATAAHWLRERVLGKVRVHERDAAVQVAASHDGVEVALASGERVSADHLALATGYQPRLDGFPFLAPGLRETLAREGDGPVLSGSFESSVPGLYFIGISTIYVFGPLFRFVAGCGAAASRVARAVTAQLAAT
ncbi:MAG: NAD(P)/FAD-dependent oxidoreductase [Deltaproteobacteria bacterium]|nr:NAD(P)/FAD-dependent oxidoreductase [Deltaproteobacteria bacterium]